MQFLSDVLIRCAACGGRRYQARVAAVKVAPPEGLGLSALSISDFLDATVEEAVRFLAAFPESKPARRALMKLSLLTEVGLGYLRLGQPATELSGGEAQRIKLATELQRAQRGVRERRDQRGRLRRASCQEVPVDLKRTQRGHRVERGGDLFGVILKHEPAPAPQLKRGDLRGERVAGEAGELVGAADLHVHRIEAVPARCACGRHG
jgi:hypothetical protein